MKKEKYCIFHIPNYIPQNERSGSQIRPRKMLEAFKNNGYNVDIIMGYGKERKKQIENIKKKINHGQRYDFLYSESSTMPTLLTEKNHLPKYPMLDFSFMKFCKKNGIKIALFYRDIQWKFPMYKDNVSVLKRMVSIPMYKYDLKKYEDLVDVFYLPSSQMKKYLKGNNRLLQKSQVLMPGCVLDEKIVREKAKYFEKRENKQIEIFYVGGIYRIYDLSLFLEAVFYQEGVHFTLCCRESEWEQCKNIYEKYLCDRITVVHESGEALGKYYQNADICCAFAGNGEYMRMAMPVKLFEYISNTIPIVVTDGTAAGEFIKENGAGWPVKYDSEAIKQWLNYIVENQGEIKKIHDNQVMLLRFNTWEDRARKVINDLKKEL